MATTDILHPFASLEWQKCQQLPVGMRDATVVWHEDKLYVGGGKSGSRRDSAMLYIYTYTTETWSDIDAPVYYFALTTYLSQLVLVGGNIENVSGPDNTTNKLWTLSEHNQWQETLPPMKTKRYDACTVNYRDHLLVAGGLNSRGFSLTVVEIYDGSQWLFTKALPKLYCLKSAILDRHWYLMGGNRHRYDDNKEVHYASLDSLLASCQTSQPSSVWKRLTDAPHSCSSTAVFGSRLIVVGGSQHAYPYTISNIYAYSFHTNSWINIGRLPFRASSTCSVVLPTGELMVVGGYDGGSTTRNVLKATIKVTYVPDSQFTMSALSHLEDVGIPVMTVVDTYIRLFQQILSTAAIIPDAYTYTQSTSLLSAWLSCGVSSHLSPTWKNLLLIICSLNLDDLAQRIETYLSEGTDLEEQQSDSEMSEAESESNKDTDKLLQLRDEAIYKLKQEISLLKEESASTIFMLKERNALLIAEIDQLRSQQLVKKEKDSAIIEEKPFLPQIKTEPKEESESTDTTSFESTWNLRGVEACGEMTVVVYSSHYQQITWPGYGLRLNIPKGCLPAGVEQCTINIKASLAGQYEFPENSHLVSAVFWLRCEDVNKFTRPTTVEIQHCAKLENVTNLKLSFVRAVCCQKQLPYTFKQLPEGNFSSHSSYGVIELNSFSGVGVTQEGSEDREYCSQLFYLGQPDRCKIHYVVTWNTEAHLTVVKEEYIREGAVRDLHQSIEFESDAISLDIPLEGVNTKGWKITPLIRPVVTKKQVDNFREGKLTPCCQLLAEFESTGKKKIPTLKHQVNLKGAKYPNDIFIISLPAGDSNLQERSQTFGDLIAAGPPPTKRSRLDFDESEFSIDFKPTRRSSKAISDDSASLAGPSSAVAHTPKTDELDAKLVKPELKDLLKELYTKAADKWEDIGILLGIEPGRLDAIKTAENHAAQSCLREMLKIWLKRISPPPSWSAIAEAIELLGDQNLADQLRTKYHVPHH